MGRRRQRAVRPQKKVRVVAPPRLAGIGVDLVSLERIRQFLTRHRKAGLERLCPELEVKKGPFARQAAPLRFARLFAAKEAFFKSLGESWMGPGGFRQIEIVMLEGEKFFARKGLIEAEGCFFETQNHVGAQVIRFQTEDQRPKTGIHDGNT